MAKTRPSASVPTEAARRRSEYAEAVAVRYVESSALVAAILEGDKDARRSLRARSRQVTSALTFAEAARAFMRARLEGWLSADDERAALRALRRYERRCFVVAITDDILARVARPFPVEPVRTLDALHLATVESLGETPQLVTIVTRDARVRDHARALGYAVE